MKREILRDRLLQAAGLFVVAALTAAFLFAFANRLLPAQEEGDVFATVYAFSRDGTGEAESEAESPP